jgi:galactokinase
MGFQIESLRDLKLEDLDRALELLPAPLDRRTKHVVQENARTRAGVDAMKRSHWQGLGRLMTGSHLSLRDDFEVSCPELDLVVDTAIKVTGVLGARMTGGGFGGSAIMLVQDSAVDAIRERLGSAFRTTFGIEPALHVTTAGGGMRREALPDEAPVTIQNESAPGAEAAEARDGA